MATATPKSSKFAPSLAESVFWNVQPVSVRW
jgi:hypothetical protein